MIYLLPGSDAQPVDLGAGAARGPAGAHHVPPPARQGRPQGGDAQGTPPRVGGGTAQGEHTGKKSF